MEGPSIDGKGLRASHGHVTARTLEVRLPRRTRIKRLSSWRFSWALTWRGDATHNLHRRHLNASQRAMVAARIANLSQGRPQIKTPDGAIKTQIKQAAKTMNVGTSSVNRAKTVLQKADPETKQAVEQGKMTVTEAARRASGQTGKNGKPKRAAIPHGTRGTDHTR